MLTSQVNTGSLNTLFSDVPVAVAVEVFPGRGQTPYFAWAESNAKEGEQRVFLI